MIFKILCALTLFILAPSNGMFQMGRVSTAGREADIQEMPWTVRLVSSMGLCTGAIVSQSWILTAAHCVHRLRNPSDIKVFFSSSVKKGEGEQTRIANKFVTHPNYWANRISKYDLALIRVEPEFEFTDKVKPLALDGEWPVTDGPRNLRKCLAGGWGTIEIGGQASNHLRAVNVTGMHGAKGCSCAPTFQNRRLVCLEERGAGLCTGDSGSALVCDGKGVGVAHMLYLQTKCKIFSFSASSLMCNDPDAVSAFIFICPELDWIREYVKEAPQKPKSCLGVTLAHLPFALVVAIPVIHYFLLA